MNFHEISNFRSKKQHPVRQHHALRNQPQSMRLRRKAAKLLCLLTKITTWMRTVNRQPWFPRGGLVETGFFFLCCVGFFIFCWLCVFFVCFSWGGRTRWSRVPGMNLIWVRLYKPSARKPWLAVHRANAWLSSWSSPSATQRKANQNADQNA